MEGKLEFTHEEAELRPQAQATVSAVTHRLAELGTIKLTLRVATGPTRPNLCLNEPDLLTHAHLARSLARCTGAPALTQLFPACRAQLKRSEALALIEKYTEVLRRHPQPWGEDLAEVFSRRSMLYFCIGAQDLARDDALQCVTLQPLYTVGYYRLGLANFALGEFAAGAQAFRAGLRVSPANPRLTCAFHAARNELRSRADGRLFMVAALAAGGGESVTCT